jgi:hypothetical protein
MREDEHIEKSPRTAEEQTWPEPERLVTPQEEAGQSLQDLADPPQAEGDRDPEEE